MRAPRVKSVHQRSPQDRRRRATASSASVRSVEVGDGAPSASNPDPKSVGWRVVVVGEVGLAPTPIRVAVVGEHHILCAHEAQARRLALGSFFSLGRQTPPHPLDERQCTSLARPTPAPRYARSAAPAGTIPCSL
jgi:hypothetical protein